MSSTTSSARPAALPRASRLSPIPSGKTPEWITPTKKIGERISALLHPHFSEEGVEGAERVAHIEVVVEGRVVEVAAGETWNNDSIGIFASRISKWWSKAGWWKSPLEKPPGERTVVPLSLSPCCSLSNYGSNVTLQKLRVCCQTMGPVMNVTLPKFLLQTTAHLLAPPQPARPLCQSGHNSVVFPQKTIPHTLPKLS